MKWSTLLPLAISTFSLLPSTGAWEITWTDDANQEHSQSGHGPSDCIVINNPKGHLFRIDSQGEQGINMLLFTNNKCSGEPAGMATEVFSKQSSQDLLGFKVVALSTTTTATTGKSVSRVATTFPTTSPSETASASSSDSGESMTIQPTDATSSDATSSDATSSDATSSAATTTSATSSTASSTTSSASSASTSNAAGQLAVSNGLVGTILVGLVQWMI